MPVPDDPGPAHDLSGRSVDDLQPKRTRARVQLQGRHGTGGIALLREPRRRAAHADHRALERRPGAEPPRQRESRHVGAGGGRSRGSPDDGREAARGPEPLDVDDSRARLALEDDELHGGRAREPEAQRGAVLGAVTVGADRQHAARGHRRRRAARAGVDHPEREWVSLLCCRAGGSEEHGERGGDGQLLISCEIVRAGPDSAIIYPGAADASTEPPPPGTSGRSARPGRSAII